MLRIGLTGSIAAGKSLVSEMLQDLDIPVIDADQLSREASEIGSKGLELIQKRFGESVIKEDGSLDRLALGNIIFSDDEARRDLEKILHPLINDLIQEKFEALENAGETMAVLDAALMIETGFKDKVDLLWVVLCEDSIRKERLMLRSNLTEKEALARMASQMPQDEKIKFADYIIDNSSGRLNTKKQLIAIIDSIR